MVNSTHVELTTCRVDSKPRVPLNYWGHIKNIHLHSCKHKTVTLKLTLTLTDTGGAVLTLMLGYRRLRIYKLKRKIQN